ncbi:AI-2E family transporter [Schaalia naturae]|uniref:AI-2E family transporter n=1 Tax=Schaalia naturae TaxID=635203 RepID=A0ABW2SK53_9ACTO
MSDTPSCRPSLGAARGRLSQSVRATARWMSTRMAAPSPLVRGLAQTEPVARRTRRMGSAFQPSPSRFPRAAANRRPPAVLPEWLQRWGWGSWAVIGIAIVVSGVIYLVVHVSAVFVGVFIALLVTAMLNPVVNLLDRWMNRWLAVALALLAFLAIFGGLMTMVVTSVAGQWTNVASQFGNGIDMIIEFLQSLPFHITLTHEEVTAWVSQTIDKGAAYLQENWGTLVGDVLSNVSGVAEVFTILALVIFTTIFFLHSGARMWRWFLNLLPSRNREVTHRAASAGWVTFSGYARGTVIVAATDGLLAGIFLQIIQVPLAPALGVLVFIGAFIPLIGAPTAMVIAMIVALASGGALQAALVGVGIAAIGQLEGHVLQPLIMGHQVSLHPLVVALGVAVGTLTAGILGAVIATPIIGVIWAVFTELHDFDPPIEGPLPDFSRDR